MRTMPMRTICRIGMSREPNTMALGGVETGSINAQEAATVAGNMIMMGFMCRSVDKAAIMGSMVVATAVFEVNSVSSATEIVNRNSITKNGRCPKKIRCLPMNSANPVF